jgi:hypothetical protein
MARFGPVTLGEQMFAQPQAFDVYSVAHPGITLSGSVHIDLGRLHVDQLIIHEVPLAPQALVLSDVESELDDPLRNYFAERLRLSLQRGFDVEPDPANIAGTPNLITELLADTSTLVDVSRRLAQHLHAVQKRPNNPGLLVVVVLTLEGRRGVALLKLERERGMRAEQTEDESGRRTFALDVIRSLLFTDNTQVFKAAVFRAAGATLEGKASDHQATSPTTDVAHFFLNTFLGCRLATAPETATRRFYEATQLFVNDHVADPVDKTRYELALLAELESERRYIDPRNFATAYLRENHRQAYLRELQAQGVSPGRVLKSTALIASALRRIQYEFNSGIRVLVRPELLEEGGIVTVQDAEGGLTRISITDILKHLKSTG